MLGHAEDLAKQQQILAELKSRQSAIREDVNQLTAIIKESSDELSQLREYNESQKSSTRHGKDKKNDMKPIAHKLSFYSEQATLYDDDEQKTTKDAEVYLTVLQNLFELEKTCDKEVNMACASLEIIRNNVRAELTAAMMGS